jgi:cold shock CspA family protein
MRTKNIAKVIWYNSNKQYGEIESSNGQTYVFFSEDKTIKGGEIVNFKPTKHTAFMDNKAVAIIRKARGKA